MVMEVMESLESSQVGDAREVLAAMVLPVVHEGEIVVSPINPEDLNGGDPGRKHEPKQPQIASAFDLEACSNNHSNGFADEPVFYSKA